MRATSKGPSEIVFVYPNYESSVFQGCSHHYGAASVRATLAEKGFRSAAIHTGRDCGLAGIVEEVLATRAPIAGFTCYDENYYLVSLLARALKARRPDLKILVGGPTATFSDSYILANAPEIDVIVRGEAEGTLPGLVAALLDGEDSFRSSPGITCRDGARAVRTPDAPLVTSGRKGSELDCIPSPYLAGFIPALRVGEVGFQTSRGCVYHCSFCNFTIISQFRVRYFSVERVLQELEFIADHLHGRLDQPVPIFDDFFSLNLKRVKKILSGMIEMGLQKKLRFLCETRADAVDREFFALLREAGCQAINFGLESAVPRVLRNSRKLSSGSREGFRAEEQFLETVQRSVAWAREEGLSVSVTVILGLPGETHEDGRSTIEFVDHLRCDTYGHNFLQVFPGTELFQTHESWGIRVEPSTTGLPYLTFPTYNLADVPFLRNGTVPSLWLERNKLLSGYFSGLPDGSVRPAMTALALSADLDRASLRAWMEPRTEVLLDVSAASQRPEVREEFQDLVRRDIPIIRATLLEPADSHLIARDVNRGNAQHRNFASRIRFVPFKELQLDEPPHDEDSVNQTLWVLRIEDAGDLDAFGREVRRLAGERIYTLPMGWFNRNLVFQDACRWASTPCASFGRDRRWLLAGSQARPCSHGGAVGALADGPEACHDNLVALGGRVAERGCEECAVRDACSRCPFPLPFQSASDYCEFRRSHAFAPLFERVLRVKNAFLRSRTRIVTDESAAGRSCRIKVDLAWHRPLLFDADRFSPWEQPPGWAEAVARSVFTTQAFLLSFPGKAYLVLPADLATIELSTALAEIWEALCMRVHPEDMEHHFCGKYGLSATVWGENLKDALGMFRDLGFFGSAAERSSVDGEAQQENFFLRNTLT